MKNETKKKLREDAHEVMKSLYKAGGIKISTLKEFEAEYFSEVKDLGL